MTEGEKLAVRVTAAMEIFRAAVGDEVSLEIVHGRLGDTVTAVAEDALGTRESCSAPTIEAAVGALIALMLLLAAA